MAIENDTKQFLVTIVQTVSTLILWLLINILVGIYFKWGLFEQSPSITNIIYYAVFIIGCVFIAKYFIKKWKALKFD